MGRERVKEKGKRSEHKEREGKGLYCEIHACANGYSIPWWTVGSTILYYITLMRLAVYGTRGKRHYRGRSAYSQPSTDGSSDKLPRE